MQHEKANIINSAEASMEKLSDFDALNQAIDGTDVTVYEELNNTRPEARAEFFADPTLIHPRNVYGNLDPEKVARNLQTLEAVRQDLDDADVSDKQKRFLQLLWGDNYKKNDFLAANIAYNEAETPEEKAAAAEYHHEANEALYGKPDEGVFVSLLTERLVKIDPEKLRPDDQERYRMLIDAIGPLDDKVTQRFEPKPETVERFSELVDDFYGDIFDAIPQGQETFTTREAAEIVNKILAENFAGTAYHAEISEIGSASVDHMSHQIKIPVERAKGDYNRKDLKKLLVHEFGVHTLRALPYEKSSITTFAHGLPNNETWDEGIAKCVERVVDGEKQNPGVIAHYINIGLATFKGKNFREVYEISTMLDFLSEAKADETDEVRAERMRKIQLTAFNRVQRCFRGTGELPNNKDLAYYNGEEMAWRYIEEHIDDPELFDNLFLAGKSVAPNKDQESFVYEMRVDGL